MSLNPNKREDDSFKIIFWTFVSGFVFVLINIALDNPYL